MSAIGHPAFQDIGRHWHRLSKNQYRLTTNYDKLFIDMLTQ